MKHTRYWNLMSKDYAHKQWFKSEISLFDFLCTKEIFMEYLNPQKNDKILEIGCGSGVWTESIARNCNEIIAIDISPHMIKEARKYAHEKNIKFLTGNLSSMSIKQKFDKIFAIRSFEYIEDKLQVIRKMHELLRSDGKLIVVTKSKPCLWDLVYRKRWEKEKFQQKKISYRQTYKLLVPYFKDIIFKPVIIRLPIFAEGNNELKIVSKRTQKYFLSFFEKTTKISRKFPQSLVQIPLTISESYLICATKNSL